MKSRSKVLCLAAAALLLVPSFPVRAEDRQGASGWQVTFNGKSMDSNFTSGKMSDEVNAMQPGDSVELTVTIKNVFDGQADWYMKNEVLESLEDAGGCGRRRIRLPADLYGHLREDDNTVLQ